MAANKGTVAVILITILLCSNISTVPTQARLLRHVRQQLGPQQAQRDADLVTLQKLAARSPHRDQQVIIIGPLLILLLLVLAGLSLALVVGLAAFGLYSGTLVAQTSGTGGNVGVLGLVLFKVPGFDYNVLLFSIFSSQEAPPTQFGIFDVSKTASQVVNGSSANLLQMQPLWQNQSSTVGRLARIIPRVRLLLPYSVYYSYSKAWTQSKKVPVNAGLTLHDLLQGMTKSPGNYAAGFFNSTGGLVAQGQFTYSRRSWRL